MDFPKQQNNKINKNKLYFNVTSVRTDFVGVFMVIQVTTLNSKFSQSFIHYSKVYNDGFYHDLRMLSSKGDLS